MATRNSKKILGTILALGAATGAIVFGSFAAWTATTRNDNNTITTGSISFTNSKPGAAAFGATNIVPGATGSDTVTLTNAGSVTLTSVVLKQENVTNTVGTDLRLKIHDSNGNCVWPNQTAGSSCSTFGAWSDAALTGAGITLNGTWAAAASRTFTIDWEFDAAAGNGTQGASADFDLVWTGSI